MRKFQCLLLVFVISVKAIVYLLPLNGAHSISDVNLSWLGILVIGHVV